MPEPVTSEIVPSPTYNTPENQQPLEQDSVPPAETPDVVPNEQQPVVQATVPSPESIEIGNAIPDSTPSPIKSSLMTPEEMDKHIEEVFKLGQFAEVAKTRWGLSDQ